MSRRIRIRNFPLVVALFGWLGITVVVVGGGGVDVGVAAASPSSILHKNRRLHSTNNRNIRNRKLGELRRTNRIDNNHELYFYYRALRNSGTMMSMHGDGAYPSVLDYFTDDHVAEDNSMSMDAQAGDGGGDDGGESGISSASFNSTNDEQTPVQGEEEGSNDLMEIALEFVGDDDETVETAPIVENDIDINGTDGSTSSIVGSSSSAVSNINNTMLENSTSVNNNDSSNSDSNSGSSASTTSSGSSLITGSNASSSDSDTSNSSSGNSDSFTDISSTAVTGSNSSTSNSDNDSSNSSGVISDSTSFDSSDSSNTSNVSTSNSDSDSSSSSGGISDSTSIDSSSDSTSNSSSGISDSTSTDSSSLSVTGSDDASTSNSNNGGSNSTSDTDGTSSTNSSSSTIPLTLVQRKSIIESKCQLSIHARSQALINLIGSFVSSPESTLITQVGPQYEAFVWLVHFDDAILCPPSSNDDEMAQRILQRYTLATLYYATKGDEWTNCSSSRKFFDESSTTEIGTCNNAIRFLDASHECNWYGISCVGDADAIDEVVLHNNNLSGAIPMEFYKAFEKLRVWNMAENQGVIGTLSNGVGRFTELEVLMLNENKLEGEAPFEALMKLHSLETINLGDNSMSGNATPFCNALSSSSHQLDTFITDCASTVTCPCCTSCA